MHAPFSFQNQLFHIVLSIIYLSSLFIIFRSQCICMSVYPFIHLFLCSSIYVNLLFPSLHILRFSFLSASPLLTFPFRIDYSVVFVLIFRAHTVFSIIEFPSDPTTCTTPHTYVQSLPASYTPSRSPFHFLPLPYFLPQ